MENIRSRVFGSNLLINFKWIFYIFDLFKKKEFKFSNIDLKTLLNKTIEISVWDKDFGKCDFIGVVQLGQQRTGDELKHFFTMVKNPELYHEQWHTLRMHDDMNTNEDSSASHNID